MKTARNIILTLLIAAMIFPSTIMAANPSPQIIDIAKEKGDSYSLEYTVTGWEYDGSFRYPKVDLVLVKTVDGKTVRTILQEGVDYVFEDGQGSGYGKHKIVKTQQTKIHGIGKYNGEKVVSYNITKAKGVIKTKVSKKTYKKKNLKKKKKSFKIGTYFDEKTKNFEKKKVTYSTKKTKKKLRKYIKVDKNGKVTLKKGTPKGTYYVTVKLKGTDNYSGMSKKVKIVVK